MGRWTASAFSRFEKGRRAGCPDFSLLNGRLKVRGRGCEAAVEAENEVVVRVRDPDFVLAVTGFDGRDVVVGVSPVDPKAAVSDSGEVRP